MTIMTQHLVSNKKRGFGRFTINLAKKDNIGKKIAYLETRKSRQLTALLLLFNLYLKRYISGYISYSILIQQNQNSLGVSNNHFGSAIGFYAYDKQ